MRRKGSAMTMEGKKSQRKSMSDNVGPMESKRSKNMESLGIAMGLNYVLVYWGTSLVTTATADLQNAAGKRYWLIGLPYQAEGQLRRKDHFRTSPECAKRGGKAWKMALSKHGGGE
jgi:hypothetical protein